MTSGFSRAIIVEKEMFFCARISAGEAFDIGRRLNECASADSARWAADAVFSARKLQIPRKIAKSIRIFSETLLTNCLSFGILIKLNRFSRANMAQSVEQRFRKPQVEGSSPSVGSLFEV